MSSKKFFSLIRKGSVHIAPGTKIIPAKDVQELLSGKELLDQVRIDAAQYKKEIVKECEELKESAEKAGFQEGFEKWVEKLAEIEVEIKKVKEEIEKVVIPVALKAAKKIVGREIELSKDAIVAIVQNSLKSVATHKRITIYVNRDDLLTLEKNKEELKKLFEQLEVLTIRERDDVAKGGCIIETEGGIINAQLENKWLVLESAFQKLLKSIHPTESKEQGSKK